MLNPEKVLMNTSDSIQVLVVDDEQDLRDGAERILTRMGFEVLKASRGDEALKILENNATIAIVLLDLKMPGMDGMEVLKRIQASFAWIMVIVITGYATVETAIEAMKKGAYDFIPKPFEPDQLRIVVGRAREKLQLTRATEKLAAERTRTLLDLDTEKSRIRTIVESLPNGLLVTNNLGQVVLLNPAARQMLALKTDYNPGQPIEDFVPDQELCRLIRDISAGKIVDYDDIPPYEIALAEKKHFLVRGQPVRGDRQECLGAVLNFVDISEMKALDELKSEFVRKVSHELRSPLSTIHEQLAFVLSDMMEEVSQNDLQVLSRAKEKTKGLISFIGDLLDLSRIEAGIVADDHQAVKLEELIQNIVDFRKTQANKKHQSLIFEPPPDPLPIIEANPMSLESIFGNLITNAINYTQEGGKIKVTAESTGIYVRLKVIDNGYGIEERYRDKIFDRFYRVKNDQTRFITGTGLGLPIVKGLVESMTGMLEVESTPGKGSTFTVLLPLERSQPSP